MKTVDRYIALVLALCLCLFAPTLHAQVAAAPASVSGNVGGLATLLANPDLWAALIALVSGLVAIWKHNAAANAKDQLTTAQKINQTLVLGIETATRLPEVQAAESKVKAVIQAKATEYGVQPILHRIVQDLTEPAAASGSSTDSHT